MKESLRDAFEFLKSIAEKKEPGLRLWKIALARLKNLDALLVARQTVHTD
jgi:hypothetical protein